MSSENPIERLAALLGKIRENPPPENQSKEVGKQEEIDLCARIESDKKLAELHGLRQDISERKDYARKTFRLISFWLAGVFLLLILQGFFGLAQTVFIFPSGYEFKVKFNLADSVLIAVVGGTTASVIGIFVYVVKYLFSKR